MLSAIIGDVAGRDVIILDDEIGAGSPCSSCDPAAGAGRRSVAVACTHGLFSDGALEKLAAST